MEEIQEEYRIESLDLQFHKNFEGWLQCQLIFNNNYGVSVITNLSDTPVKIPRGEWEKETFEFALIRTFEDGDTKLIYKHPEFINDIGYNIEGVFNNRIKSDLQSFIEKVKSLPDIFQGEL
jgi:hypothetical protein